MKRNNGFSLVEVLVSIVIIGIMVIFISQIIIKKNKIEIKTNQNIRTSMLVKNEFDIFSTDPSNYKETTGEYLVYMDQNYLKTNDVTKNFLKVNYQKIDNKYSLEIKLFVNDELVLMNSNESLTRVISEAKI